jgi:hypothetical protein
MERTSTTRSSRDEQARHTRAVGLTCPNQPQWGHLQMRIIGFFATAHPVYFQQLSAQFEYGNVDDCLSNIPAW